MMRVLVAVLALFTALTTVMLPALANADRRELEREAERRNHRANQLYKRGHYDEALRLYQAAYDLHTAPKYLFNLGLAREKTFDYEGCAVAFQEFLNGDHGDDETRARAGAGFERCEARAQVPVRITSAPTNAAVFVVSEDKELRGRTPLELALPPGEHHVQVERSGYVTEERTISVELGTRPTSDFVLEKLASVRLDVDPPDARVRIGEAPQGEGWHPAPAQWELPAGTYSVRVERDGYRPHEAEIEAVPGRETALVLSLKPLPPVRTLAIRTAGSSVAAEVLVDGESIGKAPVAHQTTPGTHRLEVRAQGYRPYGADLTIPEDRDLRLRVELARERTPVQKGVLWGLAGAAGASALAGATYGVFAWRDQAAFDDRPSIALHERGSARARTADVFYGGALTLGVTAAVMYLLTQPGQSVGRLE